MIRLSLFAVFLFAAGCSPPPSIYDFRPPVVLQWPETEAGPKIVWVRSITGYQDLEISKGFWKRMLDVLIGGDDRRIIRPYGVLFDSAERLFIADPGAGIIHCMDIKKGSYSVIGGEEGSPLRSPIGLAEDNQGRIYITDSAAATVFRYEPADGALKPFLSGKVARPTGIVFNKVNGLLYIVDTIGQHVIAVDLEGRERYRFGTRGKGAGQFNYPTDITADMQGRLYVTDTLNFRIQTFSAVGVPLSGFGEAGDTIGAQRRPKGLAVDSVGNIYICDALLDAVQVFDSRGRLLISFGQQGTRRGEFWMPSGIFIDRSDYIYVADTYNQRIQVFKFVK
jgi:sugar lactone lactonase YvrE